MYDDNFIGKYVPLQKGHTRINYIEYLSKIWPFQTKDIFFFIEITAE